jgi:FkbM family methyltransferase
MTWARVDGRTKFDHPPMRALIRSLRAEFTNWLSLGALSFVALPSRCPPRGGWKRLGELLVQVRLRNELHAECHLNEFSGFVEVWVYREYDIPGLRWPDVRTIVDVGANVGAATLWFASRAPHARIAAVEPAPSVVSILETNVARNGLSDRVQIMSKALGAATGIGYLAPAADSTQTSVTSDATASDLEVSVQSLGDLLDETGIETLDLLKLDCEGAEFEILRSSEDRVLPSVHAIVGEFHTTKSDRRADIEEILVRSGFECQFAGGEDSGLFAAIRPERQSSHHTSSASDG